MSEVQAPPWLQGWNPAAQSPPVVTTRGPGNPAWRAGCPSPNPKGRPAGIPDKRLLATQQMLDELRSVVSMLVGKALEGDVGAAAIVLSKTLPSIKAQAEKVSFDLNTNAPISEQVSAVLDGVSQGQIAPDVARLIIDSMRALSEVRATEDLEVRIAALEELGEGHRR